MYILVQCSILAQASLSTFNKALPNIWIDIYIGKRDYEQFIYTSNYNWLWIVKYIIHIGKLV